MRHANIKKTPKAHHIVRDEQGRATVITVPLKVTHFQMPAAKAQHKKAS